MSCEVDLKRLRARLLEWYDRHARELPWREGNDPYRVWVSEIMLQQTRVEAVREPYRRFVERFPTVAELAGAGEDEVLACWSGLGYYRRAKNLHRAAKLVMEDHAGNFPQEEKQARDLPGIGEYTAGAILSIAHGQPIPAVDGNVQRVLSRLFEIEGDTTKGEPSRQIRRWASRLVRGKRPGDWNQALMELGATVCLPGVPKCGLCPVAGGDCVAERNGRQGELPQRRPRPKPVEQEWIAIAALSGEKILLREGQIVKGMWELPCLPAESLTTREPKLIRAAAKELLGLAVVNPRLAGSVRHTVMNRRLLTEVWVGEAKGGAASVGTWHEWNDLGDKGLSAFTKKLLAQIFQQ